MALLTVQFRSQILNRMVTFQAVIPADNNYFDPNNMEETESKYRTIYMLNGGCGDYSDWLVNTRAALWAQEKKIALIMPSGENRFFIDNTNNQEMFGKFVSEELVEFTRKLFPLSCNREDTSIVGLSMGGYGAMVNALNYNNVFGAVGAFSTGFYLYEAVVGSDELSLDNKEVTYWTNILGDLSKLKSNTNDCYDLLRKLYDNHETIPRMFLACGSDDAEAGQKANEKFRDFVASLNLEYIYDHEHGAHEWFYWDHCIEKFIDWLLK